MRKLLNDPFDAVDEMLAGFLATHGGQVAATQSGRGLILRERDRRRRVGIVTGGGSGHEPAFLGYLGSGLADGVAVGNVFASPAATPAVEIVRSLQSPEGAVFIFGNYEGDIMNFGMAAELLELDGIPTATVLVTDDVVSAPKDAADERRGVAGDVIVLKAAGARADSGATLSEVVAAARHANAATRTVGVGLGPCTVPTAGQPTFQLADGEMDIGMGVHGEAGIRRGTLGRADAVAAELVELLLEDFDERPRSALVLVNTLGATPLLEGYLFLNSALKLLHRANVSVHRSMVGEYITSLEMTGLSLTITALDDELKELLDATATPVAAPRMT